MLQRCLARTTVLAAVALLGASVLPRLQAEDQPRKLSHLCTSLYELREAKEDRFELNDVPAKQRTEILNGIETAIAQLKKTLTACVGKVEYIKPAKRPKYPNCPHLRHAIKEMKAATEQLKNEKELPKTAVNSGVAELNKCIERLENAIKDIK